MATIAKAVQPDHRQEAPGKPFQGGDDDGDGDDGYGDDDDGDGDNQVNELVAGATVKVEADGGDGHQQMVGDTTFILYPFFSAHCAGPKGPCACY